MPIRKYLIAYVDKLHRPKEMKVTCNTISEAEKIFLETPGIDDRCVIEFIELIR